MVSKVCYAYHYWYANHCLLVRRLVENLSMEKDKKFKKIHET
jgi:hypothetical protein